jgi:hypothetical protein
VLKCPGCERAGGPFRLRHQIQADSQTIRAWGCPCGHTFYAVAGAERPTGAQGTYTGFTLEWNGRSQSVRLQRITKQESSWTMGPWLFSVAGPVSGPGTRFVTLWGTDNTPLCEWRLEPGWGPAEVMRRIKARPLPDDLDAELLARVLVRTLI